MFAGVACLPDQIYLIQRILITFGIDFQIRMERYPIIVPPQSLKCSSVPYAFCAISLNLSEALASPQPSKIFPPPQKHCISVNEHACGKMSCWYNKKHGNACNWSPPLVDRKNNFFFYLFTSATVFLMGTSFTVDYNNLHFIHIYMLSVANKKCWKIIRASAMRIHVRVTGCQVLWQKIHTQHAPHRPRTPTHTHTDPDAISYGIYVWHFLFFCMLRNHNGDMDQTSANHQPMCDVRAPDGTKAEIVRNYMHCW